MAKGRPPFGWSNSRMPKGLCNKLQKLLIMTEEKWRLEDPKTICFLRFYLFSMSCQSVKLLSTSFGHPCNHFVSEGQPRINRRCLLNVYYQFVLSTNGLACDVILSTPIVECPSMTEPMGKDNDSTTFLRTLCMLLDADKNGSIETCSYWFLKSRAVLSFQGIIISVLL